MYIVVIKIAALFDWNKEERFRERYIVEINSDGVIIHLALTP